MARDDSALVVKRAKRTRLPRRRRQAPAPRPTGLRREAEEMLRELAFVFRATQAVRRAMVPAPEALP